MTADLDADHLFWDTGSDLCFEDRIDSILTEKAVGAVDDHPASMWRYLNANFDPDRTRCTYTCVWQAYESFYDSQCLRWTEQEDITNACVKWLHDLKTKVEKIEAVDDVHKSHPYAKHRDRLRQLKCRLDEITEFVMHKFRCSKFGI